MPRGGWRTWSAGLQQRGPTTGYCIWQRFRSVVTRCREPAAAPDAGLSRCNHGRPHPCVRRICCQLADRIIRLDSELPYTGAAEEALPTRKLIVGTATRANKQTAFRSTAVTTRSSLVNKVEDIEDSKPKDGRH